MQKTEVLAMILAGGRGSRLKELTGKVAKPAVSFGGKYRIIDFPLSNCANSGVDIIGVLTQYESIFLNSYVAMDQRWGLDAKESGIYVLPPREKAEGFGIYKGTADAIAQNIDFIDLHNPKYVLILSGDHIYKMNYSWMLDEHKGSNSDLTIGVLEVPYEDAPRFGIMNTDNNDRIIEFEEKPEKPKSNLASMGIYIFNWDSLRDALIKDRENKESSHDFGKDIIPLLIAENKKIKAYRYKGYWMDVGTIESLWKANMDLLNPDSGINIRDRGWIIYTEDKSRPPQYISETASVSNSLINQGTVIEGCVEDSVIFSGVVIEEGACVKNSVVFANVTVKSGVSLDSCMVMDNITLKEGKFKGEKPNSILLVHPEMKGVE